MILRLKKNIQNLKFCENYSATTKYHYLVFSPGSVRTAALSRTIILQNNTELGQHEI